MDILHFLFWINTVINVLPEVAIRKVTECFNPKFYQKCQFKSLLQNFFVFAQHCGVQEEKCRMQKETA